MPLESLKLEVVCMKLGSLLSVRCRHRSVKNRGRNFLSNYRAWAAVLNCLIWWVIVIRVWVRIWDRVGVTVRVIVTVRVSKELGSE